MPPLVEVNNLCVAIPDAAGGSRLVVDGVSLAVGEGGTMAIVGESGCGKTLTALALLRLTPPRARVSARRLVIAGEDVLEAPERVLERLRGGVVGFVPQEPGQALNPVRTIGDQVSEAARLHRGLARTQARRDAAALLAEVGLGEGEALLDAYPHQLSGGQRQRVLIAAALAGAPRVVITDEPTSALDQLSARRILDLLERLHTTRGVGLIVISHDLGLVARAAEWVTVVYAGETVEVARRHDVFAHPAHPYTTALADALPHPERVRQRPLPAIPGQVAQPIAGSRACRFAPRCPMAFARCHEARPALVAIDAGRQVRCFLYSSREQADE